VCICWFTTYICTITSIQQIKYLVDAISKHVFHITLMTANHKNGNLSQLVTHSSCRRKPNPEYLAAIHVSCTKLFATHRPVCTAVTVRWVQSQVVLVIRYHVHGQRGGSHHWDGSRTQRHVFHIYCRQIRINNDGSKFPSAQLFIVLPLILEHILTSDGHCNASSTKLKKWNCVQLY